mmetsp:Transcript_20421/g.28292  ORF Transcript_20421/g.28292 Transcript_20421/m.28292 type:complete len:234 (-) Transcript_20421:147-848(-)|eukprot:CAMPEP_0196579878 /NCGR_PEP_ID=MMETSP1081-20130531/25462_1 /TAXON_ID=36882 /ORGANISM="Pyramimonas amylifera, Strain CCMP720" /LENGTH=233 /DNA_ID=CAMNT_0041899589 /DNA_START=201 /DNA_END=902 /DNA_ORIENTATION=+
MQTVLVTGSNRGLGLEFVKQLLESGSWRVIASCRTPSTASALHKLKQSHANNMEIEKLDVLSDTDIENLTVKLKYTPIDLLLINHGIKGLEEQELETFDTENMIEVLKTNTIAPVKLIHSFTQNVTISGRKQIVCLSSGVGSIGDNKSGGMIVYRISKAGLNMAMQEVVVKLSDSGVHVTCLAPGWVKTDMGGQNARITPEECIKGCLHNVINKYEILENGGFYDLNGKQWPW